MKAGDLIKAKREIVGIQNGEKAKVEPSEVGLVIEVRLARTCYDTEYRCRVQFNSGKTWWVGEDELTILNKC